MRMYNSMTFARGPHNLLCFAICFAYIGRGRFVCGRGGCLSHGDGLTGCRGGTACLRGGLLYCSAWWEGARSRAVASTASPGWGCAGDGAVL